MCPSSTSSSDSLVATDRATLWRAAGHASGWLAGAAILTVLVHLWYQAVPTTRFDRRLRELERHAPTTQVLVLGSSHMLEGIDPHELAPDSFNMAGGSQDLWYDAQIVRAFLASMPRLRVVVWGLDWHSFGYDLASTPGENRLVKLYDRWFPRRGTGGPGRLWSRLAFLRARGADSVDTFVTLVAQTFAPSADGGAGDGFLGHPPLAEDVSDGAARAAYHLKVCDRPERERENVDLVIDTVATLEARGVTVVFVTPPAAPSYLDAIDAGKRGRFAAARDAVLAAGHARWIDASSWISVGRGWFRDADHVQGDGTKEFSRRLGAMLPR